MLLLADFIDQELSPDERQLVEDHLRDCPVCADLAESYRNVIDLAHCLPVLPLPVGLMEKLRQTAWEMGADLADPAGPEPGLSQEHTEG